MGNSRCADRMAEDLPTLKANGSEFLNSYEKLCRKHMMIIDSGVGASVPTVASKRDINRHMIEVRKWYAIELRCTEDASKPRSWNSRYVED